MHIMTSHRRQLKMHTGNKRFFKHTPSQNYRIPCVMKHHVCSWGTRLFHLVEAVFLDWATCVLRQLIQCASIPPTPLPVVRFGGQSPCNCIITCMPESFELCLPWGRPREYARQLAAWCHFMGHTWQVFSITKWYILRLKLCWCHLGRYRFVEVTMTTGFCNWSVLECYTLLLFKQRSIQYLWNCRRPVGQ
jgi:hypothetical protein